MNYQQQSFLTQQNWLANSEKRGTIAVKRYSVSELCYLYDITAKTLIKWLHPFQHELGQRIGNYYSVMQVDIIFSKLGVPYEIVER